MLEGIRRYFHESYPAGIMIEIRKDPESQIWGT